MIHLTEKAKEVVAHLRKHGFKLNPDAPRERAIHVSARMEDPEQDRDAILAIGDFAGCEAEMTAEEFDRRLRDYVNFEAEPDIHDAMPDENPYLEMDLIYAEVEHNVGEAFKAYLRREFGDDVTIELHKSGDVEITRAVVPTA